MTAPWCVASTQLAWALALHRRDAPGDANRARRLARDALTAGAGWDPTIERRCRTPFGS